MLTLEDISKAFDGLLALRGVSTTVRAGTVHGLLGENGAGKSTLMRIAAGLLRPDEGRILVRGREIPPASPTASAAAGIAMVHQHFMLVPPLTVLENCLIGRRDLPQFGSRAAFRSSIVSLAARVGLQIDPDARVESLSTGEQQRVEIIRALSRKSRVLVLDEPTAVLTPAEVEQLFAAIARLRAEGLAVVFISHKLHEVTRICDELTILRKGIAVYHGPATDLTIEQMAEHMVGASPPPLPARPAPLTGQRVVLTMAHVSAHDPGTGRRIRDLSLEIRAGEILGIAGVEGNGQSLLAAAIVGTVRPSAGRILLDGLDITGASVRTRARAGLAHIPEDRLHHALVPTMSVAENLVLKGFDASPFSRAGVLRRHTITAHAVQRARDFDIRTAAIGSEVRTLSGGNQQKVVLARELGRAPALVLAHNPVRGLDVAATQFVFSELLECRARGAAVLLIHSDLDELLAVADRVGVMVDGSCEMTTWPQCDRAEIGRRMLGGRR